MSFSRITIRQKVGRALNPLFMLYFRFSRGMTLGVRAAVLDERNQVFLVRHTYLPGWYLPGGGVEIGQTVEEALARELVEEGHIHLSGPPELLGIYRNRKIGARDHVAFFTVRHFAQERHRLPDREIAEARFFPLDALPPDVTNATLRRIDELAGRRAPDGLW